MKRIAINGFGRIGRMFLRQAWGERGIEVVGINDLGDINNLAYLLKYDSVYGRWNHDVMAEAGVPAGQPGMLIIDGKRVQVTQVKELTALPWKEMHIDIVIEATGAFEEFEKAKGHLAAGARRVVITAPAKDSETETSKTVLMGINEDALKTCLVTSNGSCTTNAASPVLQILSEELGIKKAILSTVHGYTATQGIVDGPTRGNDFRRGRAAAQNIVPSFTGAAIAVTRVLPGLRNKFDGLSMRVPVISGSLVDLTLVASRNTTAEEINTIFKKAAASARWKGIMKVTEDQIVSTDIIGEPYGAIVDLNFTKVVDGDLVKVLSWYDNERGYVSTLVRHVQAVAKNL